MLGGLRSFLDHRTLVLFGVFFIAVQCFMLMLFDKPPTPSRFYLDLKILNEVFAQTGTPCFVFEPSLLMILSENSFSVNERLKFSSSKVVTLAIGSDLIKNNTVIFEKVLPALSSREFETEVLYDNSTGSPFPDWPVGILVRGLSARFLIRLIHEREDSSWWFGSLSSDSYYQSKLVRFGIQPTDSIVSPGLLKQFALQVISLDGVKSCFWGPEDVPNSIDELSSAKFSECDRTRSKKFEYMLKRTPDAIHFTHKVRKLLAIVSTQLDSLGVPFWISSGTCLGYFRHCNVIPHSKDVDIGVFAKDFSTKIISGLENQNVKLHLWLGELNDSLELSFLHSSNIKLDIFFFYEQEDTVWNGGTQVRTGKKFKYVFPKFDLCWTLFLGLRVRIPCDTETYIRANYGHLWHIPVVNWDWKRSPKNVIENGVWSENKRNSVIKVFSPQFI